MRISRNIESKKTNIRPIIGLIVIAVIAALAFFLLGKKTDLPTIQAQYYCDAENFSDGKFISAGQAFTSNGEHDTTLAFAGKGSSKCIPDKIYGPTLALQLEPGDTIQISLQCYPRSGAQSMLVLSSDKNDFIEEIIPTNKQDQWNKYQTSIVIPPTSVKANWKIYPFLNNGTGSINFDEIQIAVKKAQDKAKVINAFPTLKLQINKSNFSKIKCKRDEAIDVGLLFASKNDLVPGDMLIGDDQFEVFTRLKGDLLDHLRGEKWSFRILLDGDQLWRNMNQFSIHNSKSRSHIAEWLMHKVMQDEGIISPQYDFIPFEFNNKSIGVYAYEQHFDNYLLTDNKKIIGPILKHNDNGYWDNVHGVLKNYPWAAASELEIFNDEGNSSEQFEKLGQYGINQLNAFVQGNKSAEEVFDIDKMAKYYALLEICHGIHAQQITNIRFYVSPSTGLIEPIAFDFFADAIPNITENWRPIGMWENGQRKAERSSSGNVYMTHLFGNHKFYELYMSHLWRVSAPDYLSRISSKYSNEIKVRENLIKKDQEYTSYKFDFDKLFVKAKYTRGKIQPLSQVSLKTYRTTKDNEVVVRGFHFFPLEITGYVSGNNTYSLEESIILNAYSPHDPIIDHKVIGNGKINSIVYRPLGLDTSYTLKVSGNYAPINNYTNINKYASSILQHPEIILNEKDLSWKNTTISIDRPYNIPKGYTLNIGGNTTLSFIGNGQLLVDGNIQAVGTKNASIIFKGSNESGQSILLRGNTRTNRFNFCHFNNLQSFNQTNILKIDGSVVADHSKVEMNHCRFSNNKSKYDLVLNNSQYDINNTHWLGGLGTAMSLSFSTGNLNNVQVNDYAVNGIQMAGGELNAKQIAITNVQQNATSATDHARLMGQGFSFEKCGNNIKANRHSDIYLYGYNSTDCTRDIELIDTQYPATIIKLSNAANPDKINYLNEPGTSLIINGKKKQSK